jgi:hypothetical protein
MRLNFKKVASVLASAVMLGSTVGVAAAAAYPSPYIKGGAADVAVVIGASAATIDNIAAVDIAADLQAALARQTATAEETSVSATDEAVNLATSGNKLYYNSTLNVARTSLTKTELPNLLADGEVVDDSGTTYAYTQSIAPGSKKIEYGTSGGDLDDPALLIEVGAPTNVADLDANRLYEYSVSFSKEINVSSGDVQGNEIEILGQKFVLGSSSTSTTLYLYGAGVAKTLSEGESATVTVDGVDYTIEVLSIDSSNRVSVSVNGGSTRRISEGSTVKVGDIEIYAKTVYYLSKEAQVSYADLNVGSKKLKLVNGQTVKEGTDETAIQGTLANVTAGSTTGNIAGFTISIAKQGVLDDYVAIGEAFEDPVLGGIKLEFAAVTPALDAAVRDSVVVDSDNNLNARATFTSALSGSTGEYTLNFGHDTDLSSSTVTPRVATSGNKTIHLTEGSTVAIGEYFVVDAGDYGRILRLDDLSFTFSTTDYVTFVDAITGESFKLTTGSGENGSINIDGQTYYVMNKSTTSVAVTYGASAGVNSAGAATTLYPRIKLASGEWMSILYEANITNNTGYTLPGVEIKDTVTTTSSLGGANNVSLKVGNVNYTLAGIQGGGGTLPSAQIEGIDVNQDGTVDCNFSAALGPAILLLEEHKTGETNGDAVCVPLTSEGTTTVELAIGSPQFTDRSASLSSWTSDSYVSSAVDKYGTYVERDTTENNKVTLKYPDSEMYADILFATVAAEVESSGGGGTGVVELGSVAVMDSEIDTVSSKNLIVVGGSCINTVAAKVLGSDSPICGATFTSTTGIGAGQFLIEVADSPYADGKIAMLVAGYEGADTRKAATYLTANKPSTEVGTSLKKVTATYEDVVVEEEEESEEESEEEESEEESEE